MNTSATQIRKDTFWGVIADTKPLFEGKAIHCIWRTNMEAGNTGYIYASYISQYDEKISYRW